MNLNKIEKLNSKKFNSISTNGMSQIKGGESTTNGSRIIAMDPVYKDGKRIGWNETVKSWKSDEFDGRDKCYYGVNTSTHFVAE